MLEKPLSQLNLFIAIILIESTKTDSNFAISGYDLTKALKALRLPFSHQQVYRHLAKLDFVKINEVKQDSKPDKRLYSLKDTSPQFIKSLTNSFDFSPNRTSPAMLLSFDIPEYLVASFFSQTQAIKENDEKEQKISQSVSSTDSLSFGSGYAYIAKRSVDIAMLNIYHERLVGMGWDISAIEQELLLVA